MIVGFATNADQKAAETPWKGSFSIQRTGVVVHYVVSDDRKLAKPRRGGRQPNVSKHQTQQPKPPRGRKAERNTTMSWEYRGKQGPYYTRSRSINGRVVREYIGAGQAGRRAAAEDEERRKKREDHRKAIRATIEEIDQLESSSKALEGLCKSAVELELYQRGFHLWHRGWRRRRNG